VLSCSSSFYCLVFCVVLVGIRGGGGGGGGLAVVL